MISNTQNPQKGRRIEHLEVLEINFPSRIITNGGDDFKYGILFPQNVRCKEEPIPIDLACGLISDLFEVGKLSDFTIKNIQEAQGYALLAFDIDNYHELIEEFKLYRDMVPGNIYDVTIVDTNPNFHIVRVKNSQIRGYIEKKAVPRDYDIKVSENLDEEDDCHIQLQLIKKGSNEFQLNHFLWPAIENKDTSIGDPKLTETKFERKTEEVLLTEEELNVIDEKDSALVQLMIERYPSLTRENMDIFSQWPLYCRKGDDVNAQRLEQFEREIPNYLENAIWWMSGYTSKEGKRYVTIYNEDSVIIEMECKQDVGFVLTGFYFGKSFQLPRTIMNRIYRTPLKVEGTNVFFKNRYDSIIPSYNPDEVYEYIWHLMILNKDIIKRLRDKIRDNTFEQGRHYVNLSKYLSYEIQCEKNKSSYVLHVNANKTVRISGKIASTGPALSLEIDREDFLKLYGRTSDNEEMEEVLQIVVCKDDTGKTTEGRAVLEYTGIADKYRLDFFNQHQDVSIYTSEGIYIKRYASIRHLTLQSDALKTFLSGEKLDIYKSLINGKLRIPKIQEGITFFNPSLQNAENDNNQCLAVEKALGNQDILLVQGPPGTGKTTVIVEIIRQLVKQKKRVLVCSQARAAVKNILERLITHNEDNETRILSINEDGVSESWGDTSLGEDYADFLNNNLTLLKHLYLGHSEDIVNTCINGFNYNEFTYNRYLESHKYLHQYFDEIKDLDATKINSMMSSFIEDKLDIEGELLETQRYQSMDVVLGTCIGLGMNRTLAKKTFMFDTVIVDEAAKANLAETIVPMQLGKRYILVGDDNQLPPYMDKGEIDDFCSSSDEDIDRHEMYKSLSTSLFEDFHGHINFPIECIVTLNYQYRMNPVIGDYISKLFYSGKLKNASGTEKQNLSIEHFENAVTFYDTSVGNSKDVYEMKDSLTNGWYNQKEVEIICNEVLKSIETAQTLNPQLRVGIISPYRAQCAKLREQLSTSSLRECVHTIDSIQGSEFDIVVFSFVRAFPSYMDKTVGFLDDMRRLNVSLSRAKKKLILVGHLNTLTRESAHRLTEFTNINPQIVFQNISSLATRVWELNEYDHFRSNLPIEGHILKNCNWKRNLKYPYAIRFYTEWAGRKYQNGLNMPVREDFFANHSFDEQIDIVYQGLSERDTPLFDIANQGFQNFRDHHQEGEILTATILRFVEKGIIVSLDNFEAYIALRKLSNKRLTFDKIKNILAIGTRISVCISRINIKEQKVYADLSIAEKFQLALLTGTITATVVSKSNTAELTVRFNDNSIVKAKQPNFPLLWSLIQVGQTYSFLVKPNCTLLLDRRNAYNDFVQSQDLNSICKGTVVGQDENYYYISANGFVGTALKKARYVLSNDKVYNFIWEEDKLNKNIKFKLIYG